jgi:hypothetical protein
MKLASYTVVNNNINVLPNLVKTLEKVDLIFIMDLSSSDGSYEFISDWAEKDHRVKISEYNNEDELQARNMLLHMVQTSFAHTAIYIDPSCVLTDLDWVAKLKLLDLKNSYSVSVSQLVLKDNAPKISYVSKETLIHSSTARASYVHTDKPRLLVSNDVVDSGIHFIQTLDRPLTEKSVTYWQDNRTDCYAILLASNYLSDFSDYEEFVKLALPNVIEQLDIHLDIYAIQSLLSFYQVTGKEIYLNILSFYCPSLYEVSLYKGLNRIQDNPIVALGYFTESLERVDLGYNLTVYKDPQAKSNLYHYIAVSYNNIYEITGLDFHKAKAVEFLNLVVALDPTNANAKLDLDYMLKEKPNNEKEVC